MVCCRGTGRQSALLYDGERGRLSKFPARLSTVIPREETALDVITAHRPEKPRFIRNIEATSYLESVLWSAVTTVLVIRAFLASTGYPQLGGRGLHIAHMLWGGLLMFAALVLTLAVLGHDSKRIAAVIGGIGFGTFIDELGKFITSDNDYFFQPTIALIYVIFILMFLAFREIEHRREISPRESLANAAEVLVDGLAGGASPGRVTQAIYLLDHSGADPTTAEALRQALLSVQRAEESSPSLLTQIRAFVSRCYRWLVHTAWFQRVVVVLFVINALGLFLIALVVALVSGFGIGTAHVTGLLPMSEISVATTGELIASLVSSLATFIGVTRLRVSRQAAYRWFKRSILLSIFFVQVFLFYENQLGALFGLGIDLLLLGGLNVMLSQEATLQATQHAAIASQH